jgi:hypothetical protein
VDDGEVLDLAQDVGRLESAHVALVVDVGLVDALGHAQAGVDLLRHRPAPEEQFVRQRLHRLVVTECVQEHFF